MIIPDRAEMLKFFKSQMEEAELEIEAAQIIVEGLFESNKPEEIDTRLLMEMLEKRGFFAGRMSVLKSFVKAHEAAELLESRLAARAGEKMDEDSLVEAAGRVMEEMEERIRLEARAKGIPDA